MIAYPFPPAANARIILLMSPTVFRESGFRFYFFSREESRIHVHVQGQDGEAKFWLEPTIELAQHVGLTQREINEALRLVQEHQHDIRSAWHKHFPVEVTNISKHGFWLLLEGEELFLPFSEFPWFRDVPVGRILHVELPSSNHLYWPELDVDLAVESIRHPEKFPLVSRVGA